MYLYGVHCAYSSDLSAVQVDLLHNAGVPAGAQNSPREFYAPLNIPPLDARLYRLRKIVTWAGDPRKMDL